MKLPRNTAERLQIILNHFSSQIRDYSSDVSKVAELRAVRTLRDGYVQALTTLDVDGLSVNLGTVRFDVDEATETVDEYRSKKFEVKKLSKTKIADRSSVPLSIRFSNDEHSAMKTLAVGCGAKISDVIRSALIYAGVIS